MANFLYHDKLLIIFYNEHTEHILFSSMHKLWNDSGKYIPRTYRKVLSKH